MKRIGMLLLIMSMSFEISAGRVERFTPFSRADTASRRELLSKKTVAELTRKKEWLENQLQRIRAYPKIQHI